MSGNFCYACNVKYMPMSNCSKCFENNWSFEKVYEYIRATCKFCGHEVEFLSHQAKRRLEAPVIHKSKDNTVCYKCGNPTVLKSAKITKKKLNRKYHYSQFYKCLPCKTVYYDPKNIIYH